MILLYGKCPNLVNHLGQVHGEKVNFIPNIEICTIKVFFFYLACKKEIQAT